MSPLHTGGGVPGSEERRKKTYGEKVKRLKEKEDGVPRTRTKSRPGGVSIEEE